MHSSESVLLGSRIGSVGALRPQLGRFLGRCEADMLYAAQEVSVYVPRYEAEGICLAFRTVDNNA